MLSSVFALNLMIGWQFDLVIVLPGILVGLAILGVTRGSSMHTQEPDFAVPYDWAVRGV